VRADEREHGQRALLNFGHTFAHALEAEAGYDSGLLHGEAVAVGMIMALALSRDAGLCNGQDVARVRRHFAAVGLPVTLADLPVAADWDPQRLYGHMQNDKKVAAGKINFIAATAIGAAVISNQFQSEQVLQVLSEH
jgi:3-dehydroquinate synthase